MRQEGFPVEFRLRVAMSIASEGSMPVNRPARLGPMSDDAEAERGRFHGWPLSLPPARCRQVLLFAGRPVEAAFVEIGFGFLGLGIAGRLRRVGLGCGGSTGTTSKRVMRLNSSPDDAPPERYLARRR